MITFNNTSLSANGTEQVEVLRASAAQFAPHILITERSQTGELMQQSEEKYRNIPDSMKMVILKLI